MDVIIGDGCDIICELVVILVVLWNLFMIFWGCELSKLLEKSIYLMFVRMVGFFFKMGGLFMFVFGYFKWKSIGIIVFIESIW